MNQQATILLANAAMLGFRHGIDWDHIAAITDIVGTTTTTEVEKQNSFSELQKRALGLSTLYALGHASVVAMLGVAALCFAAVLPQWVDPIMERVVGVTLVLLGVWVFYSLLRYFQGKDDFELKSRWMLVLALIRHCWERLCAWISRRSSKPFVIEQYGGRTAFVVGMIHGIGAETGTQVLLIASVGGAASQGLGLAMLIAFVLGLVTSNTVIAVLGSAGFISSARLTQLYVAVGVIAGCLSLAIGSYFVTGHAQALPDLQKATRYQ